MSNQWFRMYHEFATDPKVQMLSEENQRRLIMLFCFRCNGHVTLQDEEVTFLLRISNDEWQLTKALFIEKGFINSDCEVLNWDKRQFKSDSSAERVARHRAKKKQEGNVTVTPPDTEQNRTDTDKKKSNKTKKSNFILPSHIDPAPWQVILQSRTKKKASNSDNALKLVVNAINKCRDAGYNVTDVVNEMAERGWITVKIDWVANAGLKQSHGQLPAANKDYAHGAEGFLQ